MNGDTQQIKGRTLRFANEFPQFSQGKKGSLSSKRQAPIRISRQPIAPVEKSLEESAVKE